METKDKQMVVGAVLQAWSANKIGTREELRAVITEKLKEVGVRGKALGPAASSVLANEGVKRIVRALHKKECEQYRPITRASPIKHLPFASSQTYNALMRAGITSVGFVLRILDEEGETGLRVIRNIGGERVKEILTALEWAEPIGEAPKEVGIQKVVIRDHPDGSGKYALGRVDHDYIYVSRVGMRPTFVFVGGGGKEPALVMHFNTVDDTLAAIEACPGMELG